MTDRDARDSDDEDAGLGMFEEPEGYRQPEKPPSTITHTTLSRQNLSLRLIGQSPLWGHLLWQAGTTISNYLESKSQDLVKDRIVLELGAGAGLPGITCALNGAKYVLTTDYPDVDLIDNLHQNVEANGPGLPIDADGYLWGADVAPLLARIPESANQSKESAKFDLLILADLLFNHSEHAKLVQTVVDTLCKTSPVAMALVFFTPYRPWLLEKDLAFFGLARQAGFDVEKILETKMEKVMFEEDRGDEELRRTVFGYKMTWKKP